MNLDTLHYLDTIRAIVTHLPLVEEYTCFGTPAFRVKKKLLARLKEDGETLAVHCDEREPWIRSQPSVFFITDHYRNYPMVLVKLARVTRKDLDRILLEAWRQSAPRTALKAFDGR